MKKYLYILATVPFLFFCSEEKKETSCAKPVKEKSVMYQPSELASLMKDMYEVNEGWKKQIEVGEIPEVFPINHENIVDAQSTNSRAGSDFYNTMAQAYLKDAKAVTNSDASNVKANFNTMVSTCISCHEEVCHGPISRIKKLFIQIEE